MYSPEHGCCKFVVRAPRQDDTEALEFAKALQASEKDLEDTEDLEFARALKASRKEAEKKRNEEDRQGRPSFKPEPFHVRLNQRVLIVPGTQMPKALELDLYRLRLKNLGWRALPHRNSNIISCHVSYSSRKKPGSIRYILVGFE